MHPHAWVTTLVIHVTNQAQVQVAADAVDSLDILINNARTASR